MSAPTIITLPQPYSWLIQVGLHRAVELRYDPKLEPGDPVAIRSGEALSKQPCDMLEVMQACARTGHDLPQDYELVLGAVVAVASVWDVTRLAERRYRVVLIDLQELEEPIACRRPHSPVYVLPRAEGELLERLQAALRRPLARTG